MMHGCVWYVYQASAIALVFLLSLPLTDIVARNTVDNGDGIITSASSRCWVREIKRRSESSHGSCLLSEPLRVLSSYKTTVYNISPPQVAIAGSDASDHHAGTRFLSSFPSTTQPTGGPHNMDKWRSMGKLSRRGRLLGSRNLWGRRCKVCWAASSSSLRHTGHVFEEVLSPLIKWLDEREVQGLQEGASGRKHETSKESGRDRGNIDRIYFKMQRIA